MPTLLINLKSLLALILLLLGDPAETQSDEERCLIPPSLVYKDHMCFCAMFSCFCSVLLQSSAMHLPEFIFHAILNHQNEYRTKARVTISVFANMLIILYKPDWILRTIWFLLGLLFFIHWKCNKRICPFPLLWTTSLFGTFKTGPFMYHRLQLIILKASHRFSWSCI